MNGRMTKKLRKLMLKPDTTLLILIHSYYGEKTKQWDQNQVWKATKRMYKMGLLKFKKGKINGRGLPKLPKEATNE